MLAAQPLFRPPHHHSLAGGLLEPSGTLALGHSFSPGHALAGAQLRLRSLRPPDSRRIDRGPRPELLAAGIERLGERPAGDHRSLHRSLPPLWLPARNNVAGLWFGGIE